MPVKVIDHGWDKMKDNWKTMHHSHTKVGLPQEGSPADVADKHAMSMADLVQIGAIHEFGAPGRHIPERSFIRSSHDQNRPKLRQILIKEYDMIMSGKSTVRVSLSRVGEWMTGRTRMTIKNRIPPPLHPATIAAKTVDGKRGDVPLIDTAQMIQSIQHIEVLHG